MEGIKTLSSVNFGRWLTEDCLIRTDIGWKFPKEITPKDNLLFVDDGVIKSKAPTNYYKMDYNGVLIGNKKFKFKKRDVLKEGDEWFELQSWWNSIILEACPINYSGKLYAFGFTPIVAYDYKLSKNGFEILKLDYCI